MHTETRFAVEVKLPVEEAMPLFGPEGERAWAGADWAPQFIHPQPAHDEAGAVFTIEHGSRTAVWVATQMDRESRHFGYVYFIPAIMVTTIDVRFAAVGPATTRVEVAYARTALTPEGDAHVTRMTEGDRAAGKEWQMALDKLLIAGKGSQH